ncbi:IS66 Orf2 like protein [Acidovorax sp. 93]|nr:IS66 Orf2 like protein [Acidovorax sp. 93]
MIRVDALWLATEPLDMRAGTETALARVVSVFGAARPHHAYLFANRRANRMKVLVHDGIGVWGDLTFGADYPVRMLGLTLDLCFLRLGGLHSWQSFQSVV